MNGGSSRLAVNESPLASRTLGWKKAAQSQRTTKESHALADNDDAQNENEQELDSSLDDSDYPPSSLPIASSDADLSQDDDICSPDQAHTFDEDYTIQHWSGLPPSSPPPPTSPLPMHQDVYGESSDKDDDSSSTYISGSYSDSFQSLPNSQDDASSLPYFDGFSNLFVGLEGSDQVLDRQLPNSSQNTDNMGSDNLAVPQADFVDFDFSELWQSVAPLLAPQTEGLDSEFVLHGEEGTMGDVAIDHSKLAAEMHALFSGCLV